MTGEVPTFPRTVGNPAGQSAMPAELSGFGKP